MRNAYSAHVKQLQLKGQEDACKVYLERLKILDRNANLDAKPVPPQRPAEPARSVPTDDDPLQQRQTHRPAAGQPARGRREGVRREADPEAERLFAQAFGKAADVPLPHGPQWAYCKMFTLVERLKQAGDAVPADADAEIAAASRLSGGDPKLDDYIKKLTGELQLRKGGSPAAPAVDVKHTARGDDGWAKASRRTSACTTTSRASSPSRSSGRPSRLAPPRSPSGAATPSRGRSRATPTCTPRPRTTPRRPASRPPAPATPRSR